jgi:hypothetical protein
MDTTTGRLLLPYPEAMAKLGGIGKSKFFEILPELTKVCIGRRTFVTAESVARYVDRLSEASTANSPPEGTTA